MFALQSMVLHADLAMTIPKCESGQYAAICTSSCPKRLPIKLTLPGLMHLSLTDKHVPA